MLLLYTFLVNIALLLVLTIIIACLTLVERKVLSLMQRRVGPDFVGYRGRLQYIADALKLFIKGALIPSEANKFWFICIPSFTLTVSYSFWLNAVWGPNMSIFEIEYNLIYSSLFSALFTFCIILTGFFSRNKYSLLASIRAALGMLNLELFLGLFFLMLVIISESFSLLVIVNFQEIYWICLPLFAGLGLIAITFLLEVNRTPFDLSEAESELVAGYTTEYGGFLFGVYYLGEYLHLYFFSLLLSSVIFGGWELPYFLVSFYLSEFSLSTIHYFSWLGRLIYNLDVILINLLDGFGIMLFCKANSLYVMIQTIYEIYLLLIPNQLSLAKPFDYRTFYELYTFLYYTIFSVNTVRNFSLITFLELDSSTTGKIFLYVTYI